MRTIVIISAIFLLLANQAVATAPSAKAAAWEIVPAESKIEFEALQGKSTVRGSFEKFGGEINFDPKQLQTSRVKVEIDIMSLKASFNEAVATLKTPAWLNSEKFPKAIFTASQFTNTGDNKFLAAGNFTLKGRTVPLSFNFTFDEFSAKTAKAVGSFTIKRSDFEVGDKDPKKANDVADSVLVKFTINAKRGK